MECKKECFLLSYSFSLRIVVSRFADEAPWNTENVARSRDKSGSGAEKIKKQREPARRNTHVSFLRRIS